jgi:hypothetical protein
VSDPAYIEEQLRAGVRRFRDTHSLPYLKRVATVTEGGDWIRVSVARGDLRRSAGEDVFTGEGRWRVAADYLDEMGVTVPEGERL